MVVLNLEQGHGFCVVGTRICQEMRVSNSAVLLWRNEAWECGLWTAVWDGVRDGRAESPPGGFDERIEHTLPEFIR